MTCKVCRDTRRAERDAEAERRRSERTKRRTERAEQLRAEAERRHVRNAEKRPRRAADSAKHREAALKAGLSLNAWASRRSKHGVDVDTWWADVFAKQGGKCYLCDDPLDISTSGAIHIDHDHSCCPSGQSCARCRRGLAHKACNTLIGLAGDDPDRLERITHNLRKWALQAALGEIVSMGGLCEMGESHARTVDAVHQR